MPYSTIFDVVKVDGTALPIQGLNDIIVQRSIPMCWILWYCGSVLERVNVCSVPSPCVLSCWMCHVLPVFDWEEVSGQESLGQWRGG